MDKTKIAHKDKIWFNMNIQVRRINQKLFHKEQSWELIPGKI